MATLVLSVVGTLVGGPLGGSIGAIIGQQIDQNILFAPKPRQGPRLGDLSVQTSSYGAQIPKIFGTMRAAGTVIWATDLAEHRSTSGGKGRPKVTTYAYSASFAVALSARRVASIGRIWADGKLLRGAAGDFKSATQFRLHGGDEDQPPDPLIVAAEGTGETPAYRGIAYVVFEDMSLEDFGNRIPSLTFEIVAEAAPVPVGIIVEELAAGGVQAGETPTLSGYAASGDSVRAALESLADVLPLSLADEGGSLILRAGPGAPAPVPATIMAERPEIVRRSQGAVPGEISIAYYDAARDYQTGLQRAVRRGGRNAERHSLPAVIDAGGAKALADCRLASLWTGRTTGKLVLPWRSTALRAGGHVAIEGETGLWKVDRWTLGPMTVTLELLRVPAVSPPAMTASPGRAVSETDLPHGPTVLQLLDLPLGEGQETKPLLYVAAAGQSAGWRKAALSMSLDGGATWQDIGGTPPPAVMGIVLEGPPPAGSAMIDTGSALVVELLNDAMWLEGRSDGALVNGANLAAVGAELLQFGAVEALGDRQFRLSRLLRGRRGTEWAALSHAAGESFTLIARETLIAIEAPAGAEVSLLASGVGDIPDPASTSRIVEAEVLRPPGPVHLTAVEASDGSLAISWVRRSRQGWDWADGVETPLGEETEHYRVTIAGADFERTTETASPTYVYSAAERTADGPGPYAISVIQAGSFAASRPARLIVD